MKPCITLFAFFSFLQLTNLFSQSTQTTSFNDRQYTKIDGVWNVFDPVGDTYYQVNKDVVSIKFTGNVTERQIIDFESIHQLVLKRKNVLGWHDYETDISKDSIFTFLGNLQASNLTDLVEISTIGSLLSTANDIQHGNQWYPAVIELEAAWGYETGYGSTNNYIVNINDVTKQIDVSNLVSGWYSVALMCDGILKDAKLIYIN